MGLDRLGVGRLNPSGWFVHLLQGRNMYVSGGAFKSKLFVLFANISLTVIR